MSQILTKWIADNAITTPKLDSSSIFNMSGANITGKIGINTSNPLDDIHIREGVGSAIPAIRLDKADGAQGRPYRLTSDALGSFNIVDASSLATRMTITKAGLLGLDTTGPQAEIHVLTNASPARIALDTISSQFMLQTDNTTGNFFIGKSAATGGTGSFQLDGAGHIVGGAVISGDTTVTGNLQVIKDTTVGGGLAVAGTVTITNVENIVSGKLSIAHSTTDPAIQIDNTSTGTGILINNQNVSAVALAINQGSVGMGTTMPSYNVHVYANTNANISSMMQNASSGTGANAQVVARNDLPHDTVLLTTSSTNNGVLGGLANNNDMGIVRSNVANGLMVNATASAPVYLATNNVVRMTVDPSGNLGIGTTVPTEKLDVNGDIAIGHRIYPRNSGSDIAIENRGGGNIIFGDTSGDEFMRIDSGGLVGIGTVPNAQLDVYAQFGAPINLATIGGPSGTINLSSTSNASGIPAGAINITTTGLTHGGPINISTSGSAFAEDIALTAGINSSINLTAITGSGGILGTASAGITFTSGNNTISTSAAGFDNAITLSTTATSGTGSPINITTTGTAGGSSGNINISTASTAGPPQGDINISGSQSAGNHGVFITGRNISSTANNNATIDAAGYLFLQPSGGSGIGIGTSVNPSFPVHMHMNTSGLAYFAAQNDNSTTGTAGFLAANDAGSHSITLKTNSTGASGNIGGVLLADLGIIEGANLANGMMLRSVTGGIYLVQNSTVGLSVNSSGYVGIGGVTSANTALQVSGTINTSGGITIGSSPDTASIVYTSDILNFSIHGVSNVMQIASIGGGIAGVGIGIVPTVTFHTAFSTNSNTTALETYTNTAATNTSLYLRRSRGTTIGSPSETLANDWLGSLIFQGVSPSSTFVTGATIYAIETVTPSSSNFVQSDLLIKTQGDDLGAATYYFRFGGAGAMGVNTATITLTGGTGVDVNGGVLRLRVTRSPASSSAGNAGEICWDPNYIYVCTSSNTWKRLSAAMVGGY